MAYFRVLQNQLNQLYALLSRNDNWMILVNADPDALGAAMALERLIRQKVHTVSLANINQITRPDNLAMIRYLRIPLHRWQPALSKGFQRFALVDSQPQHSPAFEDINFSVVIDHHPFPDQPYPAPFSDIRPGYGTTCTIMTEYLYNAEIRPGKRLATALQYGIRTDTGSFGRETSDVDIRAYNYLARFADPHLLNRIMQSEYLPEWLPYFTSAFESLKPCAGGYFSCLGNVDSPDILVVVADFFMKVHGLRWVAVCGVCQDKVVVVFRGGSPGPWDLGKLAQAAFGDLGSAGGHKSMARAEFPAAAMQGASLTDFVCARLKTGNTVVGKQRHAQVLLSALQAARQPASPAPSSQTDSSGDA